MIDRGSTHENFSPIKKLINYFKFKYQFFRDNPTYFYADGLVCFVGPQGSGKTLSAVNYVYNLMERFPKCLLVTNLYLTKYPWDNERVFRFRNGNDFKKYNNGKEGVIFLVDEIQLYFNSLESKNINPEVMTQISQQRKQRKHIVGTFFINRISIYYSTPLKKTKQLRTFNHTGKLFSKWFRHSSKNLRSSDYMLSLFSLL